MKKMTTIALMVAASLLASCATQQEIPSSLRFHYSAPGGKTIGLVRAFDDGEHTVLQFVTDPPHALQVFDAEKAPLTYQRMGQNIILSGLHNFLQVQVGAVSVKVQSLVPLMPSLADAPTEKSVPPLLLDAAPVAPEQPKSEQLPQPSSFEQMQQQIADLCSTLRKIDAQELTKEEQKKIRQAQKLCQFKPLHSRMKAVKKPRSKKQSSSALKLSLSLASIQKQL